MRHQRVFLIRHGETEWSVNGRHTGITDISLTENGRATARRLGAIVAKLSLAQVLTSPLSRARQTCELAGLSDRAEIDPGLMEWDYGAYEGLTQQQIRTMAPGWVLFTHGCPGGESPDEIGERVDREIARVRSVTGHVAVFAHGHVLRVFAARWIGLSPAGGRHFLLDPAAVSVLSDYHGIPVVKRWNAPASLPK
jgi:broad specificity phosphatase PhoE